MSTTADACHFVACTGAIEITDSHFQGMGDDAVNIHGYFHQVLSTSSTPIGVRFATKDNQWHVAYRRLDTVGFYDGATLSLIGTATVLQAPTPVAATPDQYDLLLSAVPPLPANAILSNETLVPTALIQGCLVEDHRGRAFVLQTRGVDVLDNHITGSTGPAISVRCDAADWWESTGGQLVFLERNVIDRSNFGAASSHAAIQVHAESISGTTPAPGAHRDLRIAENWITNTPRSGIFVGHSVRASIVGNQLSNVCTAPQTLEQSYAVVLVQDDLIAVTGNVRSPAGNGCHFPSSTNVTLNINLGFL